MTSAFNVLIVSENTQLRIQARRILEKRLSATVYEAITVQRGIEVLEMQRMPFSFVLCDYVGKSFSLVKCLLEFCSDKKCVISTENEAEVTRFIQEKNLTTVRFVSRRRLMEEFEKVIAELALDGFIGASVKSSEKEISYFRLPVHGCAEFLLVQPIEMDVYLKDSKGRYVRFCTRGETYDANDLERIFKRRDEEYVYIPDDQQLAIVKKQEARLDQVNADPAAGKEVLKDAAITTLEIIEGLVSRQGFTPEAQVLATKSVATTLKIIGSRPNLGGVLENLKRHEKQYLTSHSIMLAEVCCAIAHRVGWRSSATFFKLTLAALLHDLSLHDNGLARCRTLDQVKTLFDLSDQDLNEFKLHPIRAAEFVKSFREIGRAHV